MTIDEIMGKSFGDALTILTEDPKGKDDNIAENTELYDGDHPILHDVNRATKTVGDDPKTQRVVTHAKEVIHFQQRIVNSAVTFLFGEPVTLILNDESKKAFEAISALWKQNKLNYFNKSMARDLFIETKAAEFWYAVKKPGEPARIRVALLSNRTGYKIYPHYDEFGDMDAFTISYETKDENSKPVETVNVYTAEKIYQSTRKQSAEWITVDRPNLIGKIPVVYVEQPRPEWDIVKTQIPRAEELISNFADTNDYFASPVMQVKGVVENLPKKEETGKVVVVRGEEDATGAVTYPGGIEFVTWDQGPEAIETEYKILKDIVYSMSQTPDLSFSNVKGMTDISGVAIRLMFSDALFKAKDKQEIFGPAIERRLTIMKALIATTNVSLKSELDKVDIDIMFNDVLPQDVLALMTGLSTARAGEPIISMDTAVNLNPLVEDAETEVNRLESEKNTLTSLAGSYGV